jgi:serine protease AprX
MVMNKKLIGSIVGIFCGLMSAQTTVTNYNHKFWIKLNNKANTPYSVSTPTAFLTQKSINRRNAQGIVIDQTDLPVDPAYVSQIDAVANVQVLYASKWMNAVAIMVTDTHITAIQTATAAVNSLSFVVNTKPTNKLRIVFNDELNDAVANMNAAKSNGIIEYYGGAYNQGKQLNAVCMHGYGYRGQGMTIAILDAGFNSANTLHAFDSLFARGGVLGTRDFVDGGTSVYEDAEHGMSCLSTMAACVPSVMVGTAPEANYWLLRTEDANSAPPLSESPSEEYNWIRGAEFADSVGVDILTTSLGYTTFDQNVYNHNYAGLNGKTYPMSIAATMAVRKGMFVLNAAGNEGGNSWNFVGVPADADSICTVGAVNSSGAYAPFSSQGPTSDGRHKPDLVSTGSGAFVAVTGNSYQYGNGTSFATPIMAGAIACFWQRYSTFKPMQILDTLKKYASNAASPNNLIGWGIPNMCASPVGVKEISQNNINVFKVYPNPVATKFTIAITNKYHEILNAEIYNTIGGLVKTVSIMSDDTIVDLNSFANGIYFVKVNTKAGSSIRKIVKE